MNWGLIITFLLSRFWYLNPKNVFFDSVEYLSRWSSDNFWEALVSGHPPLHTGYVLSFWPFYRLGEWLNWQSPTILVLSIQIIMSVFTVWLIFKVIEMLFDKHSAIKTVFIFAISPFFWITNVSVMMESTYLFYWILSVYLLLKYLDKKSDDVRLLLLSGISWGLAFLTHSVVIMWIPFVIILALLRNRKRFKKIVYTGMFVVLIFSLVNGFLLAERFNTTLGGGLYWLYGAKFGEHAQISGNILLTSLRLIRNWIVPLGYNQTWTVMLLSLIGFIKLIRVRKWQDLLILSLWIFPTMITNQWWDSLFFGRHALIGLIAFVYLATFYLNDICWLLLSTLMIFNSINSMDYLRGEIPYLKVAENIKYLENDGLLIDTHFARPQTDNLYQGKTEFVDEPGWSGTDIIDQINEKLDKNLPVYISSQALSEPYGLFNGPYLHSLTLSYKNGLELKELIGDEYVYTRELVIDTSLNLDIYRLRKGKGKYPEIQSLTNSPRRLDYRDPIFILYQKLVVRK